MGLPATKWMLEIGAFLLRTETELVLKSRRVVPGRLLKSGFAFQFPTWPEAARDLCARWEGRNHREHRGHRGHREETKVGRPLLAFSVSSVPSVPSVVPQQPWSSVPN